MSGSRIVSNPDIMLGKPVVEGTRITVEYLLEELAHGQSFDAILKSHSTLSREGIQAALEYAVRVLRLDVVDPIQAI